MIPLCGGGAFSRDAYRTKQDANEALKKIEVTDRAMTSARAIDLAKEAMQQAIDVRERKADHSSRRSTGGKLERGRHSRRS